MKVKFKGEKAVRLFNVDFHPGKEYEVSDGLDLPKELFDLPKPKVEKPSDDKPKSKSKKSSKKSE